jgi:hypothetical protein
LKVTPWSPIFAAAVTKKSFWKIAFSLKMNHLRPSDEYMQWAESLGIQDFKKLDISTVKINL